MGRRRRLEAAILAVLASGWFAIGQPPAAQSQVVQAAIVEPGYLGVLADEGNAGAGIVLRDVIAGGPAHAAGLRVGDVITSIDGQTAKSADDMATILGGRPAGTDVTFVVRRGNEVRRIEVRLTKRPPPEQRRYATFGRVGSDAATGAPASATVTTGVTPQVPQAVAGSSNVEPLPVPSVKAAPPSSIPHPSPNSAAGGTPLLGVRAVPVAPALQRSLRLPDTKGALIVEVQPNSPAQKAGLPLEAVVIAIDGRPVASPTELAAAVAERGVGADVKFTYYRFGQKTEKTVRLGVGAPSATAANPATATTPAAPGPLTSAYPTTSAPPSAQPPAALPPSATATPSTATPKTTSPAPAGQPVTPPAATTTTTPAPATAAPVESETDKLRREIRALENRLNELEKQKSATPATPPAKK